MYETQQHGLRSLTINESFLLFVYTNSRHSDTLQFLDFGARRKRLAQFPDPYPPAGGRRMFPRFLFAGSFDPRDSGKCNDVSQAFSAKHDVSMPAAGDGSLRH